jgi:hypothetical protein
MRTLTEEHRLIGMRRQPAEGPVDGSRSWQPSMAMVWSSHDRCAVDRLRPPGVGRDGDGRGCAVYALGRPAAHASGQFGDAGGARAVALKPSRCASGSCTIALAVCGKQGGPVAALRTDLDCDDSVELHALKLFGSRDSLELVCHASSGAGWQERRALVEITDALAVRYVLDTGSYIAPSPDEKKSGACPSRPVGSLRVEKPGDRPLLRVVDPASGPLRDGKGTLPARQLGYDPAKHEFAPSGAPDIPTQVDARAGCRRR